MKPQYFRLQGDQIGIRIRFRHYVFDPRVREINAAGAGVEDKRPFRNRNAFHACARLFDFPLEDIAVFKDDEMGQGLRAHKQCQSPDANNAQTE